MHVLNSVVEDINFLVNLQGSESIVLLESIEFIIQITINFLNYVLMILY